MKQSEHSHHEHGSDNESTTEKDRPYWTRAHHDWRFWTVLILMIVAMVVYIVSQDLSMGPHGTQHQPIPENTAP